MGLSVFEHALAKQAVQTARSSSAQLDSEWQTEDIRNFDCLACLCQPCLASGKIRSVSAEHPCDSFKPCFFARVFRQPYAHDINRSC